ncbi:uncharacterized protein LOC129312690 [Prosopis cineraria]|uniref:uncharacterized protein LOC129312690 n=1 Tax=Prosopis cineraria TaxID=364024 RepID=UPI00240EDC73|nr:uncharacterized protein LOC129312690 [Prosopis cineraria]
MPSLRQSCCCRRPWYTRLPLLEVLFLLYTGCGVCRTFFFFPHVRSAASPTLFDALSDLMSMYLCEETQFIVAVSCRLVYCITGEDCGEREILRNNLLKKPQGEEPRVTRGGVPEA